MTLTNFTAVDEKIQSCSLALFPPPWAEPLHDQHIPPLLSFFPINYILKHTSSFLLSWYYSLMLLVSSALQFELQAVMVVIFLVEII